MKNETVYCQSEFDTLTEVIVCEPTYMTIKEPINETQRKYMKENIDKELASSQHRTLIETMRAEGVNVRMLPPQASFPEQVFMRDSGFTIENVLYVARMESEIRQGEEKELANFLKAIDRPFQPIQEGTIEGGDVIVTEDVIYVGASGRTSSNSLSMLEQNHGSKQFQWVPFDHKYLHLDCVFQPISKHEALVYPEAIDSEAYQLLSERYDCIEVSKEEQFNLSVNVLSIGEKRILALPQNKKTNQALRDRGYTIIEVDFSEIIKSGGSFRCVTLPIHRQP
ncbi:dimethylarginine dimethylaminohydrolase family protein [Shouchella sp. JSM 1781072]|uniref:dimethylarginine dimethylaminohydrolase family protein n=1 Tax=Shouchella sp. JSM 1781072 TaxID=3344581 RepID=UPI0035C01138